MFGIKDFSRLVGVSKTKLEEYHRIGVLVPRYELGKYLYGLEHINRIIWLEESGGNIDTLQRILKEEEPKDEKNRGMVDLSDFNVSIKKVPCSEMFTMRKIVDNYFSQDEIWLELLEEIHRRGIYVLDENIGMAIFHDLAYKEKQVDIEVCVKIKSSTYSEGRFLYKKIDDVYQVLSIMVAGPYDQLINEHRKAAKWMALDGRYEISGKNRNIYHRSPLNEPNPENYLTEVQIPIELRK